MTSHIQDLIGLSPSSPDLKAFLSRVATGNVVPDPEVKSYPGAVYFNYYSLGLSFLFVPKAGYETKTGLKYDALELHRLSLDGIDIYHVPKLKAAEKKADANHSRSEVAYTTFPQSPLILSLVPHLKAKDGKETTRPSIISITTSTTGQEFVKILGEPDRKGGGAGPSSGSIGIWCEWSKDGIMVEFGGDEARGPGAWERGKDAVWKVITVFPPKSA